MKGGVYDSPNEDEKLQSYVFYASVFLPFHSWTVCSFCLLAMAELHETDLTAVVSSISPGTIKSMVVRSK